MRISSRSNSAAWSWVKCKPNAISACATPCSHWEARLDGVAGRLCVRRGPHAESHVIRTAAVVQRRLASTGLFQPNRRGKKLIALSSTPSRCHARPQQ